MKWRLALPAFGLFILLGCFLWVSEPGKTQHQIKTEEKECPPHIFAAVDFCRKQDEFIVAFPAKTEESALALDIGAQIHEMAARSMQKLREHGEIACNDDIFHGIVEKGDTVAGILENASNGGVHHYVKELKKVFPLRSFRTGQPYSITTDPLTGELKRFEYEINDGTRLVVDGDDKPRARKEDIEYEIRLDTAAGVIDGNLFQAVADIGESPNLAIRLVRLFGSEINFVKNLQAGDTFSALMEKRYRDGEYKGYGRILAATFTNRNKLFEAFLFYDSQGRPQYYNSKGENLHKAFLQSPLAVTRVTSRFSQQRFHPILGRSRPHLGVDYGAPMGTPVKSVSDGIVTSRGWAGGYGNQVIVRHSSGMESLYSHLSGFSRGLRQGQKVSQGQVIGYVGSTGLSTGPHLDFRLRRNNVFVDPAKAINPRSEPIPQSKMDDFLKIMNLEKECLGGERRIGDYSTESILPIPAVMHAEEEKIVEKNTKTTKDKPVKAKKEIKRKRVKPGKRPTRKRR